MRLPAPLPDGCAMQMRYLQSSLQCCNRSLLQVSQSSSYLVPTFLFPIIANTATKVTVPIYTVPTITHDLQRNTSKEPIPKTRNPFRLFRFSALRSVAYWHVQPDRVSQIHTDLRRAQSKARVVLPHMLPCTVKVS